MLHPDCIQAAVKYPHSFMTWSCISTDGIGRSYVFDGKQTEYQKNDSAPRQTLKESKDCYRSKLIELVSLPGNSPDLNTVENFWHRLKTLFRMKYPWKKGANCRYKYFLASYNLVALHLKYDQAKRRFVEWAQNEIAVASDFHKRILFSDEAHFWLNGYVNKQNCRIWSEANPQVYVETPLHPEKLTVWCALWAGGILLQKR
ncbi:hypothetical protein TNCV_485671 [Trichonephila clavipes]|nr:hypothetical protein TNCV_485671 [Trichonephila clavipes]